MSRIGGTRLATFGLLAAALVGFWQSMRLESWGFDGPGAGFFPQLVAGVCIVLALIVLVSPGRAGSTEDGRDKKDGKRAGQQGFEPKVRERKDRPSVVLGSEDDRKSR